MMTIKFSVDDLFVVPSDQIPLKYFYYTLLLVKSGEAMCGNCDLSGSGVNKKKTIAYVNAY